MKSTLILAFLMTLSSTLARPQPQADDLLTSPTSNSGSCDLKVKCKRALVSPGVYDFTCTSTNPCVIQREDVLWLKGAGEGQQLNVIVPNYKLEEVIKAAFKSTASAGTNVNILLKRPEQSVEAEADVNIPPASEPEVNLEYEPVEQPLTVHYPIDKAYRPLSGRILEP